MIGIFTADNLPTVLAPPPAVLDGPEELESGWRLGPLTIHKQRAAWHLDGFHPDGDASARLQLESRLRAIRLDGTGGGVAVVFRVFDSDRFRGLPEEFLIGCVGPERAGDVDAWLDLLNREIRRTVSADPLTRHRSREMYRTQRPAQVTRPDRGHRLCPDCAGTGWCATCHGDRFRYEDGVLDPCGACRGHGRCPACAGAGQIAHATPPPAGDAWLDRGKAIIEALAGSSAARQVMARAPAPGGRNLPAPGALTIDGLPLTPVGCFAELGCAGGPSLVAARGKRPPANKDKVQRYLRSGATLRAEPAAYEDYFDPSSTAGSLTLFTDGTYVWPDCLSYYVDRHDVELPAEFERQMAAHHFEAPTVDLKRFTRR